MFATKAHFSTLWIFVLLNVLIRNVHQFLTPNYSPAKVAAAALAGVATCGLLAASPAQAQQHSFEIGAGAGFASLDDKLGGDSGLSLDLRIGYFVTDRLALELEANRASSILDGSFTVATLNVVYHFGEDSSGGAKRFVPYVLVGAGLADVELDEVLAPSITDDSAAFRAAIGGRLRLGAADRAFLRLELGALSEDTFDDRATHVAGGVSFVWRFGGRGRE